MGCTCGTLRVGSLAHGRYGLLFRWFGFNPSRETERFRICWLWW